MNSSAGRAGRAASQFSLSVVSSNSKFGSFLDRSNVNMAERAKFNFKKEQFDKFKEYMKCYLCSSMPRPETILRSCRNRHPICSDCFDESTRCCDSKPRPSGLVDKVLADLPFQCKFAKYGCEELFMKENLFDHEADCHYRIVKCPDLGCHKDISFLKMLDHLDEEHSDMEEKNTRLR